MKARLSGRDSKWALRIRDRVTLATKGVGGPVLSTLAISLLLLLSLGSWAFASAVGGGPDDDYHLTSVWCSSFSGDTCEVDPNGEGVFIPEALREGIYCYYHQPTRSAGCQPFLDGSDSRPDVPFAHNNPSRNLYPDTYYKVGSLLKTENIERTALSIRFLNIGVFLTLGIALFWALPLHRRNTLVWMWALTMVPMVMFIVASSNPSAWALTAVGGGWLALLGYLETRGARAGVLASLYLLCAVLAVSSRVDSVLYLGLASLLAVFLSQTRGVLLLKKMWIALVGVLFVVARLIANPANLERVIEGLGQRSGGNENPLPWTQSTEVLESGAFDWSLLWNNLWSVPGLWLGTFGGHPWGSLGWLDTKLPQIVLFSTLTVLAGVIFAALKSFDTKKSLSLAVAMGALWIMPLYLLQLGGFQVGEEIQPRYLLPLTVLAVGILVLGSAQRPFTLSVRQQWFAVVALSLANSIALHTNLRRYVTGTLVEGFNLESPQEWWWPFMPELISPTFVWAIGTLSFTLVLWVLLVKRSKPLSRATKAGKRHLEKVPS
jgi:hypothetical protein